MAALIQRIRPASGINGGYPVMPGSWLAAMAMAWRNGAGGWRRLWRRLRRGGARYMAAYRCGLQRQRGSLQRTGCG